MPKADTIMENLEQYIISVSYSKEYMTYQGKQAVEISIKERYLKVLTSTLWPYSRTIYNRFMRFLVRVLSFVPQLYLVQLIKQKSRNQKLICGFF